MKTTSKVKTGTMAFRRLWLFAVFGMTVATPVLALETSAEIDWNRRVELSTPVKGVIKIIAAQPGQQVAKDKVLLQLDQRGFISRVEGMKAQVAHLKAALAEAEREQERALELYDRTVLSDHELQVTKNNLIEAKARYEMGVAELVQAELDLEYSAIRAPFDAMVVARMAEVGQTVVPHLQVVTQFIVADARHMLARGRLTAKDIEAISIGQEAVVEFDGKNYKGQVITFGLQSSPKGEKSEKSYFVNVQFPLTSSARHVGQPAKIILQ